MPCTKERVYEIYKLYHDRVLTPLGKHVKLKFNMHKTTAAICQFEPLEIHMSRYFIDSPKVSEKEVTNTILHEMAHVIAGFEAGHGPTWKRIARSIGCDAMRCTEPFLEAKNYKYVLKCGHGCIIKRHKIKRGRVFVCKNHQKLMKE